MKGGPEAKRRGYRGEEAVGAWLRERGWRIVERNFHSKFGEVDLIAEDGTFLAFVEVKLRRDEDFAAAREAVTLAKQRRLRMTAALYLQWHPTNLQPRFDVAEVYAPKGCQRPEINYLENAF